MASHAGLVLVLETKDGYIDSNGKITKEIENAKLVSFYQAGFSSAYQVFQKLGFLMEGLKEENIRLSIYEPSYEERIGILESIYQFYGYYDEETCYLMASNDFERYHLQDYEKFKQYRKSLEEVAMALSIGEDIKGIEGTLKLYHKNNSLRQIGEIVREEYYSKKGDIYGYHISLKCPHVERFFHCNEEEKNYYNHWQIENLEEYLQKKIMKNRFECHVRRNFQIVGMIREGYQLSIYTNDTSLELEEFLTNAIRDYYSSREMHITRMFGSYILLQKIEGELTAVKATPIPIKYCPLMVKLLKEVGGENASMLLETLKVENQEKQIEAMCNLINEVVIKGGYFDTSRPLNSCEANVLFGASEIMFSAFQSKLIDAAVIVSNNLGTIITTNDFNTQGAVKRMTGLFYTSPSLELLQTAKDSSIIPVFPMSAEIDQLVGVKKAISLGYKNIAVSVAASDNILHKELESLEKNGVTIYKFGLCSTGISEEVALSMKNHADVIWSCASKYVKEFREPFAIAQVGVKIPVHIMTKKGWILVRNHLLLNKNDALEENLVSGDEKPVYVHAKGKIKMLKKKDITHCEDCPHPCI